MNNEIDPRILEQAKKITRKRPKTVIDHIIKYGAITTEELKEVYGYNHPPRAARDVREEGIPLETIKVTSSDGRLIGAYIFGDPEKIENNKLGGRVVFPKKFKDDLAEFYGSRCNISLEEYDLKYLQIDHRIPYEVAGEGSSTSNDISAFMLLSASAQRQKSWDCENCQNIVTKDILTCKRCYWAYPEEYDHIALKKMARLDIEFVDEEVTLYKKILHHSDMVNEKPQSILKRLIKEL